jgi:acetolactate synthase-1/2/3 large subunit
MALSALEGTELLVLVGTKPPVSFFAYPNKPSWLTPDGCQLTTLTQPHEDSVAAMEKLVDALDAQGASESVTTQVDATVSLEGDLDSESIVQLIARYMPQNAIFCDEGITASILYYDVLENAAPHDHLNLTGGAIGSMMPVATGASVACPERKVVTLIGDGSAMYTVQSLWTQAHEQLDVVTIVLANRAYKVLNNELKRVGAAQDGPNARRMLDLHSPVIGWTDVAKGFGVSAARAETRREFERVLGTAIAARGPWLIEAVID